MMSGIIGLIMGLVMQAFATHTYGASQAEGFLAYIGGFIIGFIIWEAAGRREARK